MKTHFIWIIGLLFLGFFFQNCQSNMESGKNDNRAIKTPSARQRPMPTTPGASPGIVRFLKMLISMHH